jgi:WD40 repeat protein
MPSRCAIWARVSTDEQESGNQLDELRTWAARRSLDVAAEYIIDGATAGADKTARLWGPATGEHLRTLTRRTGWVRRADWVRGLAFSPDGRMLATVC